MQPDCLPGFAADVAAMVDKVRAEDGTGAACNAIEEQLTGKR